MHGLDEGEGTDDVSILSKEGYNKDGNITLRIMF
ncbi:hypothetical protein BANRA_04239 [Escherichia coli]|nr:hypothetical protein BANRA_04239 [Escherichia coli]